MKLNKDQALNTVISTIQKELRHPDYKRTVELADLYKKIITGKNIESLLLQFNPRENLLAFNQRKAITKVITPALSSSVMKPFYKVPRTDRVVKKIIPTLKKNQKIVMDIQNKLNLFYGSDNEEGGLDFWLKNRFIELSFIDPNTFIVIEFDDFDPKESTPNAYPFEVKAEMAVNFEIENNNVDWLIVKQPVKYVKETSGVGEKLKKEMTDGDKYTIYCGEFSYVLRQISDNKPVQAMDLKEDETAIEISGKGWFAFSEYDTKLEDWQMFRIGYKRDLETDGRTYVSELHPAICYFEKSIKSVSEFDLTNAIHVFPQKIAYVSPCPGYLDDKNVSHACRSGRTTEGSICSGCKGTGARLHSSSQDVMTMPLPESKADHIPLNEMMAYFAPPIELLEFQSKQIDKFEPQIHQAIFNSTVLVQKTTVATATEKDQDMDSVYDTLTAFANKSSAVYLNVCNAIALLLGYSGDVTFVHRYPADFKMKSRQILYNEMKTINDSGAPSFVKDSVEDDLANQVFVDDPEGLLKYTVKKKFLPFRGLTDDQIAFALSSVLTTEYKKVLKLNFEDIMEEAEVVSPNFYLMKQAEQKKVIDEIVARYITELTPKQPVLPGIVVKEEEDDIDPAA